MGDKIASIKINEVEVKCKLNEHKNDRGVHIVIINPKNGVVEQARIFDTYRSSQRFEDFISKWGRTEGYIVAAACKDDMAD